MKKAVLKIFSLFLVLFSLASCNFSFNNYYYENAENYVAGSSTLQGIENIEIDWVSGKVMFIESDEYSDGLFMEEYIGDLSDDYLLHYYKQGNKLNIKFVKSGANLTSMNLNKTLKIYVSKEIASTLDLDINVISADVNMAYFDVKEIDINSVSGNSSLSSIKSSKIDIESVSGNIKCIDLDAPKMDFNTVSGNVNLSTLLDPTSSIANMPKLIDVDEMNIETVSGDTNIFGYNVKELDHNSVSVDFEIKNYKNYRFNYEINTTSGNVKIGFYQVPSLKIDLNTASGDFNCTFPVVMNKGQYIIGEGENFADINTTSGDISLDLITLLQ